MENYLPCSALVSDQHKLAAASFYLGAARSCNTFRNSLAHGIYLSDAEGTKVELLSYATTTGKRPKQILLTETLLKTETDKVLQLRDAIRNEFFPDFRNVHRPKHIR